MHRSRLASLLVLAVVAAVAMPAMAAPTARQAGLAVTVDAPSFLAKADRAVVRVTFANDSARDAFLLSWQTPLRGIQGNVFDVRRDGQAVAYVGMMAKFAAPRAEDYVRIPAGGTRSVSVDLSRVYDFSRTGEYTIQYRVGLQDALRDAAPAGLGQFAELASNRAALGVERDETVARFVPQAPVKAFSTAYNKCTAAQQSQLLQARSQASSYAAGASSYLGGANGSKPRYTTWFGAPDTTRYNTVKAHYPQISRVMDNEAVTFDCGCKKKNTYAYVYPNRHYTIYLCGAFWAAPLAGTDSRGGTLVHETSHFDDVANTDDYAYGQSACKSLAISNPAQAVMNADSHEYFAENTPALQ